MSLRLAALFLLFALGAGAVSGVPAHAGGDECGMGDMMMDCCARARAPGHSPDILAARLCCVVNCQHPGATERTASVRVAPPEVATPHPAAGAPPTAPPLRPARFDLTRARPNESPPVYLLHLSLLI
jgi:hypothetical protein